MIKSEDFLKKVQIHGLKRDAKIAVAMSGGVDSSVSAVLLKTMGYDIFGITLDLYRVAKTHGISCKDGRNVIDAKKVCEGLGIDHYVVDFSDFFMDEIISDFVDGYSRGITPNPCVICNREIKFGKMLDFARDNGADYLSTGHYIGLVDDDENKNRFIAMGGDLRRDQSYFLARVKRDALNKIVFPLANFSKDEVREIAEFYNLSVAQKPASNDLCFVSDGNYLDILHRLNPNASKGGVIVHIDSGKVLGEHQGIAGFTIGQRRGVSGGGNDTRLYVIKIDELSNTVYVGGVENLRGKKVLLRDINWLGNESIDEIKDYPIEAKLRANQPLCSAILNVDADDNSAVIEFSQEILGIAPGQVCGFYKDNKLFGGAYIVSSC